MFLIHTHSLLFQWSPWCGCMEDQGDGDIAARSWDKNYRKGFGICIFSNKPASLKCCVCSRPCSAYTGVRGDTESTSLLPKKHRKTKETKINKVCSASDLPNDPSNDHCPCFCLKANFSVIRSLIKHWITVAKTLYCCCPLFISSFQKQVI